MPFHEPLNRDAGHDAERAPSTSDPLQVTSPPPASPGACEALDLALDVELPRDVELGSDFDW